MRLVRSALLTQGVISSVIAILAGTLAASAAQAQDAPAADAPNEPATDIVVTGTRASLRAAVTEKRDADNFVEALHANDVGKLPDQNVAEAVKRLPGIAVYNDQGEGRYLIIRGVDPALVNVALNGQTLPAPEPSSRQVKLDDLPSGMIQSITVTKSLLASQDANAIGGEVNIRTKTAFDSKTPFFFDGRAAGGWYDMNHKSPIELDGTVGGRFGADGQFGAVASVNYSRRQFESENFQGEASYAAWRNGVPSDGGLRDYHPDRMRLGVVGNLDWHPSDDAKLYIRASYSKFTDHETRDQNLLASFTGEATGVNTGKAKTSILVRHREEDDNTKSLTAGGDFNVGGGKLSMSAGWTKAVKVDPIRSEYTFAGPSVNATFDGSTNPYSLVPSGADANIFNDPTKFTFSKLKAEHRYTYEQIWQGRIDYSLPIAIGDGSEFQVGLKYLDRHKNDDHDLTSYKPVATAPWTLDQGGVGYISDTSFYGNLFHFGERIDWYKAQAYLAANPAVGAFDYSGNFTGSLSPDFDVREKVSAGYAMLTLKFGRLTLLPGVRVEYTTDNTGAKLVNGAVNAFAKNIKTDAAYAAAFASSYNTFNVLANNSYTDIFPGLNVKFDAGRGLLFRAGITTAIGRPNYSDLAPTISIGDPSSGVTPITAGNPYLKPYKAVNYDLAVEFYPNKDSLFSAGFFYKDIDNPIYSVSTVGSIPNPGNIPGASPTDYPTITLIQSQNLDKEFIGGIEFNAQTQFTSLPGFLSGFGISGNYTYVWGHATAPGFRAGDVPLAHQSHYLGNVAVFYEKYGFAARLAFNYRSRFIDVLGATAATDDYWDAQGQLDFHMSYQIRPQFTVFGDASNLTDSPWRHYEGAKAFLVEREQYGVLLRGGVQVHF